MTLPALNFEAPPLHRRPRRVRSAAAFQRQAEDWELCTCPSCIACDPRRREVLIRRRAALKRRFWVED